VTSSPPPLARSTDWVFASAGIALGIVNTGLNFFLLLYYDQVLGLAPALAGLALALALVIDGITDPLVGVLSDRWRSRWGRRHPFLYASVIPLAGAYLAIWFPPVGADNQAGLFAYLLAVTVALRIAQTLFDVPTNALMPELTRDYEARTRLSMYKVSFTWITSNATGILMYAIWLRDDGSAGSGLLRAESYQAGALWFAGVLVVAAAAVPLALHRYVPYLAANAPRHSAPARQVLRNVMQTYANRSMLALLGSAVFLAAASGLTNALWVYLYSFYWGFTSNQVNAVQFVYLGAAITALLVLPRLARGRDKRILSLWIATAFWLFTALPYLLQTVGFFPAAGSQARVAALLLHAAVDGLLFNMLTALLFSLLADVVEDNLLRTGRREEGLILSSQTFITKTSGALGTWSAAMLLTWVAFPRGVTADAIDPAVLSGLGGSYVAAMWLVGLCSILFLGRYRISRAAHAENVSRLSR